MPSFRLATWGTRASAIDDQGSQASFDTTRARRAKKLWWAAVCAGVASTTAFYGLSLAAVGLNVKASEQKKSLRKVEAARTDGRLSAEHSCARLLLDRPTVTETVVVTKTQGLDLTITSTGDAGGSITIALADGVDAALAKIKEVFGGDEAETLRFLETFTDAFEPHVTTQTAGTPTSASASPTVVPSDAGSQSES